ncbi:hypothetical protein OIDMADRAFT_60421 [Oidiodendron maius Zn]|uniref:Uncharacterized protein n=1 Tax=Oidiodendron maius (strain Zn) TaxID=913774 RepID=A0A0C3GTN6_OIDMZ|nr:hypothetical protein OIDMADRAFT_60421 [Oidiodendron maius Zn]
MAMADPVTFSVGDVGQYTGSAGTTPTMSGSVVEFTAAAQPDGSVEMFLSPDLQNTIKGVMDANCKTLDDNCFQSVRNSLINPNTELVSRQLSVFGAVAVGFAAILFPFFYKDTKLVPVPIVLHPSDMSAASAAATATELVAVPISGARVTITPTPNALMATTGTAVPAITAFPSAGGGHQKGDVVITLPGDLASRITDFLATVSDTCPAGQQFSSGKLRKRQANYGPAICASEALIQNAAPGGMFDELLVLQPQALPWTAADAVRAMNVAVGFAQAQAPDLRLTPARAGLVGVAAFAIAWDVYINNQKLSNSNTIPGNSLQGSTTIPTTTHTSSSSSTGCPTPSCVASCTKIGALAQCDTSCVTPTGTCSAARSTNTGAMTVTTTAIMPWIVVTNYLLAMGTMAPSPVSSALAQATQSCYPKNTTAPVGAINAPTQSNFARTFCTKFNRTFNSTTPAVLWNALSAAYKDQLSPYHYTVSWIPGCTTSVTQQSMSQPLGASDAAVNCVNLLTENFSRCTSNNGAGGTRDVGCLRYNFAQTLDQAQIS